MTIPVDAFTRIRGRAATVIARFGAPVLFFGEDIPAQETSPGVWTSPQAGTQFDGVGISTKTDPNQLRDLGNIPQIILQSQVIILVAAQKQDGSAMAGEPKANLRMRWPYDATDATVGTDYSVKGVAPVAPNGRPIYYVVGADT